MDDICTYFIEFYGQVEVGELNAISPLLMTPEGVEGAQTLVSVCTDQSGLIGLMRHLHGLGLVFLSVTRSHNDRSERSEHQ
jgi:hypothetical protein